MSRIIQSLSSLSRNYSIVFFADEHLALGSANGYVVAARVTAKTCFAKRGRYSLLCNGKSQSRLRLCGLLLGHTRATGGTEHETHLPGINDSFVLIAVVE